MKSIVVGKEKLDQLFVLVDDEDYPLLNRLTWYPLRVRGSTLIYAQTIFGGSSRNTVLMHQLIKGNPPRNEVIDHINGNGLDNRKENLQFLPNSENIRKRYQDNPDTGIKLKVDKMENPWQASISLGGKTRHVGYFPTKELAKAARDEFLEEWLKSND